VPRSSKNKKPSKKFILSLYQYIFFLSGTICYYIILLNSDINIAQQDSVLCCNPKEVTGRNKPKVWTMTNSLLSDEAQWIRGVQSCHCDVLFYCEHSSGYCWWWVLLHSVKCGCNWVLSSWKLWNDRTASLTSKCTIYEIHFMLRIQLLLLTKPRNLCGCKFIDLYSGGVQCKSRPRYRLSLQYLCRFLQYIQEKYPIVFIQVLSNLSVSSHICRRCYETLKCTTQLIDTRNTHANNHRNCSNFLSIFGVD